MRSSRHMKQFLKNNVHWSIECVQQPFDNVANSSYKQQSYFKENIGNLNAKRFCSKFLCDGYDEIQSEENYDRFNSILNDCYVVLLILGIVSLLGNGSVIIYHIKMLIKLRNTIEKEKKLYNILVLNLCFADLLMAVYLIIGPIALVKSKQFSSALCNALGFISALSIQTSASFLAIITAYRLYGVRFPYKRVSIKKAAGLLLLVWLCWLAVVSLPLLNENLFARHFTYGVEISKPPCRIALHKVSKTVEILADSVEPNQNTFSSILNVLRNYKSNEIALQVLESFTLVNFKSKDTEFLEFYNSKRGCTIEAFTNKDNAKSLYLFALLMFNLTEYLFILFAYLNIFVNISALRTKKLIPCVSQKDVTLHRRRKDQKLKNENKKIYLVIFIVVLTDLIFGLPTCMISLVQYIKNFVHECKEYQTDNFQWVTPIFVLVLIPLNSIINPYIYSFHLWKSFYKFVRNCCRNSTCHQNCIS